MGRVSSFRWSPGGGGDAVTGLTGIFWAVTYLGCGLPVLLVTIEPAVGIIAPLIVLSIVAVAIAVLRSVREWSAKHAVAHMVRDEMTAIHRSSE